MVEVHVLVGEKIKCLRCGYEWSPRLVTVNECPRCHSAKWSVPLTEKELERRVAAGKPVPAK